MEKKFIYQRKKKLGSDIINLAEAYKVYALNNGLPAYDNQLKNDGDFYLYMDENGELESREFSATYDEMIAKIIISLFKNVNIKIRSKLIDSYIEQHDSKGLGNLLVEEMENDLKIQVLQLANDSMDNLVLRFGKKNALNMNVGTVLFDENNELHVAYGKARRALFDVAEGFCK